MTYSFDRETVSGVIVITVELEGKYSLRMLLDTGASRTTIDSTALYMTEYQFGKNLGVATVETANGIVEVEEFETNSIASLGIERKNFPIQVYDFLAHGILSDYDGVLGLDFFENTILCLNLKDNTLTVSK
ncbi:MAG: retroviral-like aspartic protease family protein [Paludibacter sp.]|jgi:predicted aspartyl protease|nr:retroviral-like aspartic protease family protein [Paludibacter sp.]